MSKMPEQLPGSEGPNHEIIAEYLLGTDFDHDDPGQRGQYEEAIEQMNNGDSSEVIRILNDHLSDEVDAVAAEYNPASELTPEQFEGVKLIHRENMDCINRYIEYLEKSGEENEK